MRWAAQVARSMSVDFDAPLSYRSTTAVSSRSAELDVSHSVPVFVQPGLYAAQPYLRPCGPGQCAACCMGGIVPRLTLSGVQHAEVDVADRRLRLPEQPLVA